MEFEAKLPLSFQKEIFEEVRNEDGLCVVAPGLSSLRIVANILAYYSVPGSLLILLNANDTDIEILEKYLDELKKPLVSVNTDSMSVDGREKAYKGGGIFAVTSRILVLDMLTHLIPVEFITGLVVLHADRITATGSEAFVLRLFRQGNRDGFIKAFTDEPERLTMGINALSGCLRCLFLKHVSIFPRFHVHVAEALENSPAAVVEFNVEATESQKSMQTCIITCIESTIKELRRINSAHLDMEQWTVDSLLHRSFDIIIRRQLDPLWHRLSSKTKTLVSDLTTLRSLLTSLISYDCISFLKLLDTVILSAGGRNPMQNQSPWLLLEPANTLINLARQRVYSVSPTSPNVQVPVLEALPKWDILKTILDEIKQDASKTDVTPSTLIMCADDRTCFQIKDYLLSSSFDEDASLKLMQRKLRDYLDWLQRYKKIKNELQIKGIPKQRLESSNTFRKAVPPNKRRRVRGGSNATTRSTTPVEANDNIEPLFSLINSHVTTPETESSESSYFNDFSLNIKSYDGDYDDILLEELSPNYIIMYDADPAFIRRVEVYRATHPERQLKVYFTYYGGTVEEQRYLFAVRREKDSFSRLIRERANMTVLLTTAEESLTDPEHKFLQSVNTRIAGGGRVSSMSTEQPRVIVDLREFRSTLPSMLHGHGFSVVPCQLTVGDYILSPKLCVERKSVPDLIQSLNSGRLYSQCESMQDHYEIPILLIEFDQNKSFQLEPFAELSAEIGKNDLQSKLVLLTLCFPKLKIIWSSSAYATVLIFSDLKALHEEPDPETAVSYGLEPGQDATSTLNRAPVDLLLGLPYVSQKNYRNIVYSNVKNVTELCDTERRNLTELIGPECGNGLYNFMRKELKDV
ncbi:DNA repair endonuclease XPF [Schizosaccharomyces japonicus yFS275]|uniref:DNA repair endonuclease XPF n=1 Tax=Schizosaccharomyces japonicus (strain yFS275 / FY16936) TaxID=402676 RepID=B6K0K0_SCHJY|nr:DNA repair endonuclease XPF [Schizosaccharomyces japonicus yFS275]EEB07471.2 DNA repair endonuclease XPF [Schizosaccharomyces japonicus yFS275]